MRQNLPNTSGGSSFMIDVVSGKLEPPHAPPMAPSPLVLGWVGDALPTEK